MHTNTNIEYKKGDIVYCEPEIANLTEEKTILICKLKDKRKRMKSSNKYMFGLEILGYFCGYYKYSIIYEEDIVRKATDEEIIAVLL